jgi:hypothetical protein
LHTPIPVSWHTDDQPFVIGNLVSCEDILVRRSSVGVVRVVNHVHAYGDSTVPQSNQVFDGFAAGIPGITVNAPRLSPFNAVT